MAKQSPTLISFYGGAEYYHRAAADLRADCERLGIAHDIREIQKAEGEQWSDICRRKIRFYRDMLDAHPDGIFWVDVDTRLIKRPNLLRAPSFDFAAFLRNFKDFKDFDPVQFARTFHPGFVFFNGTTKARKFVEHMCALEDGNPIHATDDYFLEEAWRTFRIPLSIMLLSSDLLAQTEEAAGRHTCFIFGASGNVANFRDKVEQHTARAFEIKRQTTALAVYAGEAIKSGKREEGLTFLKKANTLNPRDPAVAKSYAKLLLKVDKPKLALQVVRKAFGDRVPDVEARRVMIDALLGTGNLARAEANVARLERSTDGPTLAFAKSRRFLLDLELRAQARALTPEDRPGVWWMDTPFPGNLGDILNPYIVEKLSGLPPRRAKVGTDVLAIGSVIKFAKTGTRVWGTGTPRMTDILAPDADYRAVRGPLTRKLVLASGGNVPEVYGDAAMLLPLLYRPNVTKKHRLGLIRHYTHADASLKLEGVKEIEILRVGYEAIESFIDELNECEAIISTSLHGLIVAHAYGIPTRWADFPESEQKIPGDSTKFEDHYAAFGIEYRPPLDLSKMSVLTAEDARLCTEVVTKPFDAKALLAAAPFPLAPEWSALSRGASP